MPIAPSEVSQNLKAYLDETGGTDGPPIGKHQTAIMSGETHPSARMTEDGRPEVFFIAQISEGQHERRTVPATLRWFVSETDREGNLKEADKIVRGEAFVRKLTREFLQAIWGRGFEDAPEGVLLPAAEDSPEEVYEVFKDIAGVLGGTPVGVTVKYRDGSDFPDLTWKRSEAGGSFSL